ncbi:MAG: iron ABC transporter permease [Proteobacteria bacterium]|nr:iron ABC transporter permease [Pseudomonadota bacterium]
MLRLSLWLFYALLAAPLLGLIVLALRPAARTGGLVWTPALASTLTETFLLLGGVGLLSSALGVGAAWLIAMYRFPGREWLAVMLVLPLALPTYLAAYLAVEMTDFFGPFQRLLRTMNGATSRRDYWFPEVRSLPGAIVILSLVLFPYIYLPARLMFERQVGRIIYAARLHGARGFGLFFRIGLPLARPAIAAGATFALLETLNDVGAVEHLGVQSLSLAVRSLWLNRGNLPGAAQVSLGCLVLVGIILLAEHTMRRHAAYANSSRAGAPLTPMRLRGWQSWAASFACALPVIIAFVLPTLFLVAEAIKSVSKHGFTPGLLLALGNSVLLSLAAAIAVGILGGAIGIASRVLKGRIAQFAPRLATLGYAIPGSVLVIALLPVYSVLDDGLVAISPSLIISGTLTAILLAYVIRFAGIGITQVEASLARMSPNIDHAARTLGSGINRLAFEVLAPNIRRGVGLAVLFAFVDAMKELPATLLLRPLNMETLATSLYAFASGGAFESGAVEALLLFGIGLVPVLLLARAR